MKTPRELLLAKHQAASPKLDEVRREAVNDCRRRREESLNDSSSLHASHSAFDQSLLTSAPAWKGWPSLAMKLLVKAWQELFVPCRRVWYGLAGAWTVILLLNLASSPSSSLPVQASRPEVHQFAESLLERRRMQVELLGLNGVEPPRSPAVTRPRSEGAPVIRLC